MFPIVVSAGHSTAEDVDCHSTAGTVDAVGTNYAKGIDHDSTNWMAPGTSIGILAEGWCVDECCF